ncbi:hypothetical protein ANTQUA_LOCUS3975 [Anthophora quadrimaculata]
MKLIYVICILFTTTIGCIATDNANATQGDIKTINQQTADPVSKATPLDNSTSPDKIVNASVITINNNNNSSINITTPTVVPTNVTIVNVDANVTNNTKPSDNHINTDPPMEPSTTAATITTESTVTTPEKPTTTPNVTSTTVPNNRSNNSVAPEVSTVSVSPKTIPASPPSSQGRMFDGLSFVGGIIWTICSIGIAALSWKFYRSISDGNYHIL